MRNKSAFMVIGIVLLYTALICCGTAIAQGKPPAKLDLNKATAEQLSKCPGLTLLVAKAIADYRSKAGPFKTPDDLLKVKGVTKEILTKLNPKLEKDVLYVTPKAASDDDDEEPSLKPSKC